MSAVLCERSKWRELDVTADIIGAHLSGRGRLERQVGGPGDGLGTDSRKQGIFHRRVYSTDLFRGWVYLCEVKYSIEPTNRCVFVGVVNRVPVFPGFAARSAGNIGNHVFAYFMPLADRFQERRRCHTGTRNTTSAHLQRRVWVGPAEDPDGKFPILFELFRQRVGHAVHACRVHTFDGQNGSVGLVWR